MSGYRQDFSRSNNAHQAELDGRLPATKVAKALRLPVKFIQSNCAFACGGEYHHTSKFFNATLYYDTAEIQRWINGESYLVEELGGFVEVFTEWRKQENEVRERRWRPVTHDGTTVCWLEWGGTRRHPRATKRRAEGCTVVDKGNPFVVVTLPNGSTMRKKRDCRGFEVFKDGKLIRL
jgi:hypothetical protein